MFTPRVVMWMQPFATSTFMVYASLQAGKLFNDPEDLERKVVELVDMAIEGCELDAVAFGILSRAISKGGTKRFPEAMKALEFLMRNNSKRGTQLWIQTG
ncbi:hypothetical protein MRB53_022991 [Persea americana]|uniref:Uncharacterized protein n=1 Tax=Persea americana TaxID=3435 RepID=A0ACC2L9E0_PERAE|nr:hypothetical protein MRB53_022991 [Persea americana]